MARVSRGRGVHSKVDDPAAIVAEAERLTWLRGRGIPCPAVVAVSSEVLVTTTLPGRPAAASWPSALAGRVADGLADVLRALHALPVADCPFDQRLAVTLPVAVARADVGLVDLDDLDDERLGWSAERLVAALRATVPATEDLVVGHGDFTPDNVVFTDDGRLSGVIDVGRLGVTDRYADLALMTRDLPLADRFLARYGVPSPDPAKLAFYRLLDEFF
jgi:aminoglycoside phosphotransferase